MNSGPEFSTRHEAVTDDYFFDLINHVAPYESKIAIATILASKPDTFYTGHELKKELTVRQEPFRGWAPDEKTLSVYCSDSFAAMDLVDTLDSVGKLGRTVTQYRIVSDKAPIILGLAGRLMAWSLRHKLQSTQQLLGSSKSTAYTPSKARYQIYAQLIKNPEGIVIEDLSKNIQATQSAESIRSQQIIRNINELWSTGVLDVNPPSNALKATQSITIRPDHVQPLTDLYNLLEDFRADPANSNQIDYARSLINSSLDLSKLMKKGRDFSASAIGSEMGHYRLDDQALKILANSVGIMTVRHMREALAKDGRKLGEDATRSALNRLVAAGLAESEDVISNNTNAKAYSVKNESK